MLKLVIPLTQEGWDEIKEEFIEPKFQTIQLEHSLVSISKWESKWNKPYLHTVKNYEETIDYIKCMTLTQNVDQSVYNKISIKDIKRINEYIDAPMTATTFSSIDNSGSKEIITSEILYYDMIALGIPFECQKWHLNRLITLIKVCNIKSNPPKKMGRNELISRNKALNEARRKQLNTRG